MSYEIQLSNHFDRKYKKLTKYNKELAKKIRDQIKKLQSNPFTAALRTHKVISRKFGQVNSSRITSDLRLIWIFKNGKTIILTLDIGGHDGKNSVY